MKVLMKKFISLFLCFGLFMSIGCAQATSDPPAKDQSEQSTQTGEMIMKIDNQTIDVVWENNDSVTELLAHAKNGLTIKMNQYGNFEQVGPIGKEITSNDKKITTTPGDIMLYDSNQIVIFYGSNTWNYTKLGHINLNETKLNELLNKNSVTLYLGNEKGSAN